MKQIKIIIPQKSTAAKAIKKYFAEKDAFRKAAMSGNAKEYAEKNSIKFACPISATS